MSKTIMIFNDGTGQSLNSKGLSNVAKIFKALPGQIESSALKCDSFKRDNSNNLNALYYRGIGTEKYEDNNTHKKDLSPKLSFVNWLKLKLSLIFKMVVGDEIDDKVEAIITDLMQLWNKGDKVILIGFSRGAAGVRLAAHLAKSKIPDFEVTYIVAFDTVYSVLTPIKILDLPETKYFENIDIAPHIKALDHLIAGDEMRSSFPITPVTTRQGVRQILFSGAHADVGGGADTSHLSDVALSFALRQLEAYGIKIDCNITPNVTGKINYDLLNGTGQTHFPRDLNGVHFTVHKSVKERIEAGHSAPIALSTLLSYKFPNDELVEVSAISTNIKAGLKKPALIDQNRIEATL